MSIGIKTNERPAFDTVISDIVDYVFDTDISSSKAYETARYSFIDGIGCGLLSLDYPACTKMTRPGATMAGGPRVPGTSFELEPVMAAFNIDCMIRWLISTTLGWRQNGNTHQII